MARFSCWTGWLGGPMQACCCWQLSAPMLMVACLLMTSGDRGVSLETSSVAKFCGGQRQGDSESAADGACHTVWEPGLAAPALADPWT